MNAAMKFEKIEDKLTEILGDIDKAIDRIQRLIPNVDDLINVEMKINDLSSFVTNG